jgi:hypothetical protein
MISPDGYVSFYSLMSPFPKFGEDQYDPIAIRKALEAAEKTLVYSLDGGLTAVPKHVISTAHEELFLFLDETSWCVSMKHLRDLPERLGQEFDVGLGLLGVLGGSPLVPIPQVADALVPLEGHSLVLNFADADAVKARLSLTLTTTQSRAPKERRQLRGSEAKREFLSFIKDPNNQLRREDRDRWSIANLSGGREAGRILWTEFKPPGASKPGPK